MELERADRTNPHYIEDDNVPLNCYKTYEEVTARSDGDYVKKLDTGLKVAMILVRPVPLTLVTHSN